MSVPATGIRRSEPSESPTSPVESRSDLATVRRLQHVRGFPAVSILLSTIPSDRLTRTDAAALEDLIAQAVDRLLPQAGAPVADLEDQLGALSRRVAMAPTEQALALYAHADHTEIVRLPRPVRNRVVVAETFATGDVVMAFRHAPHYLLLLLGRTEARLFDGYGRQLEERNAEDFRALNPWRGASDLRAVGWDVDAAVAYAARQRSYLRRIDAALDAVEKCGAVPLVLAGDPLLSGAFVEVTTHPERVAGTVPCDDVAGLDAIGRLAGRLMAGRASRRERKALATLGAIDRQLVATGTAEVWPAAIRGEGETLLVEECMTFPARISGDGLGLRPAAPEGGRGIVADVIGELAWAVSFYGGEVLVVPAGTLSAVDRIALILRSPVAERQGTDR